MLDTQLMDDGLERRARAWTARLHEAAARRVLEMAGGLVSMIMADHPVASGESRAGWYPAAEALGVSFASMGRAQAVARGRSLGAVTLELGNEDPAVIFANGVEYVIYLEYGTAGRPPLGMVRNNVEARRGELAAVLREDLIRAAAKDTP